MNKYDRITEKVKPAVITEFESVFEKYHADIVNVLADILITRVGQFTNITKLSAEKYPYPTTEKLSDLVKLVVNGMVHINTAKNIIMPQMEANHERHPAEIIDELGLRIDNDSVNETNIILSVLNQNLDRVQQYNSGKTGLFEFFMGKIMQESSNLDPSKVSKLLKHTLDSQILHSQMIKSTFNQLRSLTHGWKDGEGYSYTQSYVDRLDSCFLYWPVSLSSPPAIFPTIEKDVVNIERVIRSHDISIELELDTGVMDISYLNLDDNREYTFTDTFDFENPKSEIMNLFNYLHSYQQ